MKVEVEVYAEVNSSRRNRMEVLFEKRDKHIVN